MDITSKNKKAMSEDELAEILEKSYHSIEYFCLAFMSHIFVQSLLGRMHKAVFEIIDDRSIQQFAVAAPRDFGKTMINVAL